jgi:hypothetical protein
LFFELCDFAFTFRGRILRLPLLLTPLGAGLLKKIKENIKMVNTMGIDITSPPHLIHPLYPGANVLAGAAPSSGLPQTP